MYACSCVAPTILVMDMILQADVIMGKAGGLDQSWVQGVETIIVQSLARWW
jgi:hypothetical protein